MSHPAFNALLNGSAAILLLVGWVLIKQRRRKAHASVMLTALTVSIVFLISYVTYHLSHGSTKFAGTGIWRPVYFTILTTHTILAVVNVPLVLMTVRRAALGTKERDCTSGQAMLGAPGVNTASESGSGSMARVAAVSWNRASGGGVVAPPLPKNGRPSSPTIACFGKRRAPFRSDFKCVSRTTAGTPFTASAGGRSGSWA